MQEGMTKADWLLLRSLGVGTVSVEYDGEGDSGCINQITCDGPYHEVIPDKLREKIEDTAYVILAERYGGWEINEGSYGTLTFDLYAWDYKIAHNERIEDVRHDESGGPMFKKGDSNGQDR